MLGKNVKAAIATLKTSKWRTFLTVSGIIIGVVSVVTTVSLGEGVKQQVVGQVNRLGNDLITVRPGRIPDGQPSSTLERINLAASFLFGSGSLSQNDLKVIQTTPQAEQVVPLGLIDSGVTSNGIAYNDGYVIGTTTDMPDVMKQSVQFGQFFGDSEELRHVAVIGSEVAKKLFGESAPIGGQLSIRGQTFVVRGILKETQSTTIAFGPDFNKAVFIPYQVAQQVADGSLQLAQVLVRPLHPSQTDQVVGQISSRLKESHGGQEDFSVLRQDENLVATKNILDLFTGLIAAIAALSLLVGGVGIMNIMLVSVTERTREIGIRKAVGATNNQILSQFLVEAIVLSLVGGILGVIFSLLINALLRVTTDFQPVINIPIVILATGVSLVVGVIFGLMPAARAARKDPIDALRYE